MSARIVSWRASKSHRNYTIEVATSALEQDRGTVRLWIGNDLSTLTDSKSSLILGEDQVDFLKKRGHHRTTCGSGEFFCFRCRVPRRTALEMAEIVNRSVVSVNRRALCAICETPMNRRIPHAQTVRLAASMEVSSAQDPKHMRASGPWLAEWSRVDIPEPTNDIADTAASGDEEMRDDR